MATTAEEKGLLGATWFADHPVLPLEDITVALNIDTIAISPRGTPVATIGRGRPAYDAMVRSVAAKLGRKVDADGEADAFRSEEHTSELQSLMRISYAVFCLKKKNEENH